MTNPPANNTGVKKSSNGSKPAGATSTKYEPHFKGKRTLSVFGLSQKGLLVGLSYEVQTPEEMKAAVDDVFHDFESMKFRPFSSLEESLRTAIEKVGDQLSQGLTVSEQSDGHDEKKDGGGEYRVVKIIKLKLLYTTTNGNPYILVQGNPGLAKHGVNCWTEVFEPVFGKTEDVVAKYGVGKDIPIPAKAAYAVVLYSGGHADKVVEFKETGR